MQVLRVVIDEQLLPVICNDGGPSSISLLSFLVTVLFVLVSNSL